MAADSLRLLFELDADAEPSIKELKRFRAAFASELNDLKRLAESAAKLSLVENRSTTRPGDGTAASKVTLDSQREVNRQLEAMWANREKEQAASLKKQADLEKSFGSQQVSTTRSIEKEITDAYRDRELQLAKTAKRSEDAWAKHEAAKLAATRQAEKEGEAAVTAASAAKDKAAKSASDNFLKQQKQNAAVIAAANAQTAANEIRAALLSVKGTADVSSIARKSIDELGDSVNVFVGQRIPLFGGAFIRVTDNLRNFNVLAGNVEASTLRLGKAINALAVGSGKTASEIKTFLAGFKDLGTQAEKDAAAIEFFGAATAQKLLPQLATAEAEMSGLTAATAEAGEGLAGLLSAAGPVGFAIAAVAVQVGVLVVSMTLLADLGIDVGRRFLDLAKSAAGFRGEMLDLSQQLGISTETLSAFQILAETTGGDIGSISASLGIFQKNLDDIDNPTSKASDALRELGISSVDTEEALRQALTSLAAFPEGAHQTALALEVFGRGGKSILAILKEMHGDLDGAIERFRKMGLVISREDAEAADKFNDQLKILEDKFRALLGRDVIPAATDAVEEFSKFIDENREEIRLLNEVLGTLAGFVRDLFKVILNDFRLVEPAIEAHIKAWHRLADAIKAVHGVQSDLPPVKLPDTFRGLTPVPLPAPTSDLAKAKEEARLIRAEIDGAVRFANEQVDAIDRQLKAREIAPATALETVIAVEKEKTRLVVEGLQKQSEALNKEFAKEEERRSKGEAVDEAAQRKRFEDVQENNTRIQAAEDAFRKLEADKRAEFRAQELQREQVHRRALADIFVSSLNDQIATINRAAQAGTQSDLFAQDVITELLKAGFAKRKQVLEQERTEAGKDPALAQQINTQLADLQRERTATLAEQADRRIQILRDEQRKQLDLERQTIDSLLRASEITDNSLIATIKALADLRVKTEERAAKEILKIRLDAVDREKSVALAEREIVDRQINQRLEDFSKQRQALEGELKKAGTIADPEARVREQARIRSELQASVDAEIDAQEKANKDRVDADTELNNKLRILGAERSQIQAQGNRDIDEGRKGDLSNAQKYADGLKEIQRDIADIDLDRGREVIELMRLHFARRKDIIRAERDLDLKEEIDRHRRASDSIKVRQSEVDEEIRVLESHLKSLKIGTTEEIEEHERLISELEKLRLKRAELKAQQEAEDLRHETRKRRVTKQSKTDEVDSEAIFVSGPDLTHLDSDLENVGSVTAGVKATLRELKEVGLDAFQSLAQGIGSLVENYVLLGTTGPAALRKLLAATLAQIAAESAVKAIYWTAQGIVDLFFNPARAAADFAAAALWASLAGGSALVGRKLAGNLFQSGGANNTGIARSAVSGGAEVEPRNRAFNGQGQVESASRAAQDGSGSPRGFFDGVFERLEALQQQTLAIQRQQMLVQGQTAQQLTRIQSMRHGDALTIGTAENPGAVGRAVINHSNSDGDFNEALQRNLGLA